MDATTSRLVDFAARAKYSDLPPEAVHECKRRLIDTLACGVGAYDEPLCVKARAVAQRYASTTSAASVLGCGWKAMPEAATFANGVMTRFLDMTDTYLSKTPGHPSDVIPGILAVGEAVHADGASVINAITLAYDTYCTFCESVDIHTKGWDQPVCVGLATVTGVGKLLGLNREQMGNAVALTMAPNMALLNTRRGELSHWKGCAAANGARNAVFAAYLAQDNLTGPSEVFEGKYGIWDHVGRFDWEFSVGAGAPHRVTQTRMKCFPIVYHAQSAAWAGLDIRTRLRLPDISEIRVETYEQAVRMNGTDPSRWAPKTHETADHSLPYILAIALIDGAITSQSFMEKRLTDPAVLGLMGKMKILEDAEMTAQYPEAAPCRLTIRLKTGEEIVSEIRNPKGDASNPMQDKEIEKKFRDCFKVYGSASQCERALGGLWAIERCRDIGDVMSLFVTDSKS